MERAAGAPKWVGRRVVGEINAACGACATCRAGRRTHCERRTVLGIVARDGAFADAPGRCPSANLHAVPEGVPDEVAVFTEPTAAALEIQEQVRVSPGDRVVVIGDRQARATSWRRRWPLTGCRLLVVGRSPRRLALLEAARGIRDRARRPDRARGGPTWRWSAPGTRGPRARPRAVRPRGTIVLKSTYHGDRDLTWPPSSSTRSPSSARAAARSPRRSSSSRSGDVDVRPLVEARYPLAEASPPSTTPRGRAS